MQWDVLIGLVNSNMYLTNLLVEGCETLGGRDVGDITWARRNFSSPLIWNSLDSLKHLTKDLDHRQNLQELNCNHCTKFRV
jgi:hypothetical protein